MPTTISEQLAAIFARLKIASPASFTFEERPVEVPTVKPVMPAGLAQHPIPDDPLVRALQRTLYDHCYARPFGVPRPPSAPADPGFAARLSASNKGITWWEPEWRVYQLGNGGLIHVQKGERCRTAMPGEFMLNGTPGRPPQTGNVVSLLVQKESYQLQPGFYHAFGEVLSDHFDDFSMVRFYFHATERSVEGLIEQITSRLNRYQIPFQFKCLADPASYNRTDAAVLYVARRFYNIVARIVAAFPADVLEGLRKEVPLFSRTFRDGIGIAEDPANGESFGMHRCRLTAEGITDAWATGETEPAAWLEGVRRRFRTNGLDLDAPHLSYGTAATLYDFNHTSEVTA